MSNLNRIKELMGVKILTEQQVNRQNTNVVSDTGVQTVTQSSDGIVQIKNKIIGETFYLRCTHIKNMKKGDDLLNRLTETLKSANVNVVGKDLFQKLYENQLITNPSASITGNFATKLKGLFKSLYNIDLPQGGQVQGKFGLEYVSNAILKTVETMKSESAWTLGYTPLNEKNSYHFCFFTEDGQIAGGLSGYIKALQAQTDNPQDINKLVENLRKEIGTYEAAKSLKETSFGFPIAQFGFENEGVRSSFLGANCQSFREDNLPSTSNSIINELVAALKDAFKDNMIKPNKNADSFKRFISKIKEFGVSKIKEIKITSASSKVPATNQIPSGESALDHGQNLEELNKQTPDGGNIFLAQNRGLELEKAIKEALGPEADKITFVQNPITQQNDRYVNAQVSKIV